MIDQKLSGTVVGEFEFPVVETKIKEFSLALKNPEPLYIDKTVARKAGYSQVLMPVTFTVTFPFHMQMQDAVMDTMKLLGMNETTSVHGEVCFNYDRVVQAGEVLRAVMRIGRIYEKDPKKGGKMTFVEMIFDFYDASDIKVCDVVNLFIEKS